MKHPPLRWELYLVDFGSGVGSEQRGTRPALVVSNNGFNQSLPLATVLPLTKQARQRRPAYRFEVRMAAGSAGNNEDSLLMPHQVRSVSRDRLLHRLGKLESPVLRAEIEDRLSDHLGFDFEDDPGNA